MQGDHQQHSDSTLEALAAAGDRAAFGVLYDRHSGRVYDFVLRKVRDPEAAADIAQETFLRAMRALKPGEKPTAFGTWLFKIAENAAIDHMRKARPVSLDAPVPGGEPELPNFHAVDHSRFANPEAAAGAEDLAGLVWEAAQFLNPRESTILDLHLRQDLDSAEIAHVLGISKGNAYTIVSRLKSTFEEAVAALVMLRSGRKKCADLDGLLHSRRSVLVTPQVRKLVSRHVRSCAVCQDARAELLSPATLFGAFALVPMPLTTNTSIRTFIDSQWDTCGPAAIAAATAGAGILSRIIDALAWAPKHAIRLAGDQVRNITMSWPYQTTVWKATHVVGGLVVSGSLIVGGVSVADQIESGGGQPRQALGAAETPSPRVTDIDSEDDSGTITGGTDLCPAQPEDLDGPSDDDGCPEPGGPVTLVSERPGETVMPSPSSEPPGASSPSPTSSPADSPIATTAPASSSTPTASFSASPTATSTPTSTPEPSPSPGPELAIIAPTLTALAGTVVTAPVHLTAPAPGVGAYSIEVSWSLSVLQATACTPSATCKYDYTPSSVRMSGAAAGGFVGTVTLAEISFLVIGPSGACSELTIVVTTLSDPGTLDLNPAVVHGKICSG